MSERSGRTPIGVATMLTLTLAACAGSDDDPSGDVAAAGPSAAPVDEGWREETAAFCADGAAAFAARPTFETASAADVVAAVRGEVSATIDVGSRAVKSHPADGRMIVRTADTHVAIDPATDAVVATLGIDCGQVYATRDLVVAWPHNDDEGESGAAAAAFIDPATNQVIATTPLPGDPNVPVVLDDTVFFPANRGSVSAVVDRTTWQVASAPDYGRWTGGSQAAFDGESIYLIAEGVDVLVIDAETFEQTDVIEPLSIATWINSVATSPGALCVATSKTGILQRFDIPS